MASRWTDSGINWANLALHEDRTSWIIDELYRATSEKDSLVKYMREINLSVDSWDSLYSQRDAIKLDEIITQIKYWLEPVYVGGTTNGEYSFFDYEADPSTWTAGVSVAPFYGCRWFDSSIGGNFELLVGDLSLIRDWSITQSRINTDLLQLIYDVLINLNVVMIGSGGTSTSLKYIRGDSTLTTEVVGSDTDFLTAVSEYNSDTPSTTPSNFTSFQQEFLVGSSLYKLDGTESIWSSGIAPRDSGNNTISTDGSIFSLAWLWHNGNDLEFPSLTYDTLSINNNVGNSVLNGIAVQPFNGFINSTSEYRATALPVPLITLNDHWIEYH